MKSANTKHGADYERAKKRAIAQLKKGFNLGFIKSKSRNELHDRAKLRSNSESLPDSGTEESS